MADLESIKREVALANRMLAHTGLVGGVSAALGHVSYRIPDDPEHFVIKGLWKPLAQAGAAVTDLNTGLMWEKKSDDGSIHDMHTTYSWDTALTLHVSSLRFGFAGYTDWRLPNRKELASILDLEESGSAVDPVFDTECVAACTVTTCSCTASSNYWSATSFTSIPTSAWFVSFNDGVASVHDKSNNNSVRAVRGGR